MKTLLYIIGSFVYFVVVSSHPIVEYIILALVLILSSEMFFIYKANKNGHGLNYYIGPEPKEEEPKEEEEDKIEQEEEANWLEIKYRRYIFYASVAPFFLCMCLRLRSSRGYYRTY